VLVSLGNARQKGADAGIQGNLNSIRTQAELYASGAGAGGYGTVLASGACPSSGTTMFGADPTIKQAVESARSANGGTLATVTQCAVGVSGASYAVAVQLKAVTGWWCVDSNGIVKNTGSATAPALLGGTVAATCP